MQPSALQQTLAGVESLNQASLPFAYRVEGNQIIGEWKFLDAVWAAPLAAQKVDKDFRTTITFDESKHTYSSADHSSSSASGIGFNPLSGTMSVGGSHNFFNGQMKEKQFGFGLGLPKQNQNTTAVGGPTYQYKFNSDEIKQPLFDYLAQAGWQKNKNFLGKLFSK